MKHSSISILTLVFFHTAEMGVKFIENITFSSEQWNTRLNLRKLQNCYFYRVNFLNWYGKNNTFKLALHSAIV